MANRDANYADNTMALDYSDTMSQISFSTINTIP